MEASNINGPWTACEKVPSDVTKAEKQAVSAKQVDLLAGQDNRDVMDLVHSADTPVCMVLPPSEN